MPAPGPETTHRGSRRSRRTASSGPLRTWRKPSSRSATMTIECASAASSDDHLARCQTLLAHITTVSEDGQRYVELVRNDYAERQSWAGVPDERDSQSGVSDCRRLHGRRMRRREHRLAYGRQDLSISRPKAGAGQQGQFGKERTT